MGGAGEAIQRRIALIRNTLFLNTHRPIADGGIFFCPDSVALLHGTIFRAMQQMQISIFFELAWTEFSKV